MKRGNTRGRKERERLRGGLDRKGDDAHASLERQALEKDQNKKGMQDASSTTMQKEGKSATKQTWQHGKAQAVKDSIQEISFAIQLKLEEFKLEKGCILQVQKSQERPFHNLQLCQKVVNESFEPIMPPHPPLSDSESIELVILPPKHKPLSESQSEIQLIVQKKRKKSNKRIRKVPKSLKNNQKPHFPTKNPQKKVMRTPIESSRRNLRSRK